jgi:hypothetical protein
MKKVYIPFLLMLLFGKTSAQSIDTKILSAAGGNENITGLTVCWTLGETFINEFSDNTYKLSQGFHQGDLSIPSGIKNISENIHIYTYPNPVRDYLTIQIMDSSPGHELQVLIYDIQGKVLYQTKIKQDIALIDFSEFADGQYIIKLSDHLQCYKTINLIKQSETHEKN